MTSPAAAKMGATIMLEQFPGSPPMQCFSATLGAVHLYLAPTRTMAAVSATVSDVLRQSPAQEVTKAAR